MNTAERLLISTYHFLQDMNCRCLPNPGHLDAYSGQMVCDQFGCPRLYLGIRTRIAQYFGDGDELVGYKFLNDARETETHHLWNEEYKDQVRNFYK